MQPHEHVWNDAIVVRCEICGVCEECVDDAPQRKHRQEWVGGVSGLTKFHIANHNVYHHWEHSGEFYRSTPASSEEVKMYAEIVALRSQLQRTATKQLQPDSK